MAVLFLLLEGIFIAFVAFEAISKRSFISKKTFFYTIPMFVLSFAIYSYGAYSLSGSYGFLTFSDCVVASLKNFAFETKEELIDIADPAMATAYYISVALSGLTLVFSLLGLAKAYLYNWAKKELLLRFRHPDIVISCSKASIEYCKRNKSILYLDKSREFSQEFLKSLFEEGVVFMRRRLDGHGVSKVASKIKGNSHVIYFEDPGLSYRRMLRIIADTKLRDGRAIHYYVETNIGNNNFMNKQLSKVSGARNGVIASCFNVHELIGRRFALEHCFASYLTKDIKGGAFIKPGKRIKAIFLGAGKTNSSLLRSCVLNNHFAFVDGDRIKPVCVEYELYDQDEGKFASPLLSQILPLYKQEDSIRDCRIQAKRANVYSGEFLSYLRKQMEDEDGMTFVFIGFSNSIYNASYADRISTSLKGHAVIFYNVDSVGEQFEFDSKAIIPCGFKNELLTHKSIVNEDVYSSAIDHNSIYNLLSGERDDYSSLSVVEKLSNVYSEINLRSKLSLLGLRITSDASKAISKAEYQAIYSPDFNLDKPIESLYSDYSQYFKANARTCMAFIEHYRWVSYYLLSGFVPMDWKKIRVVDGKPVHKDLSSKEHACLVGYYELDELNRYEVELCHSLGVAKTISEVETYRYDFQQLDGVVEAMNKRGLHLAIAEDDAAF